MFRSWCERKKTCVWALSFRNSPAGGAPKCEHPKGEKVTVQPSILNGMTHTHTPPHIRDPTSRDQPQVRTKFFFCFVTAVRLTAFVFGQPVGAVDACNKDPKHTPAPTSPVWSTISNVFNARLFRFVVGNGVEVKRSTCRMFFTLQMASPKKSTPDESIKLD